MDAMERLKDSMTRVKTLIDFKQEHSTVKIFGKEYLLISCATVTSSMKVSIEDLNILVEALEDRDISTKRPDFIPQKEIERDIVLAKETIGQQNSWIRGYHKGYEAGLGIND